MSDREFREIQLSWKQLVFVFISTVVLAVVIFLLGVAVGRGVRGTVAEPGVMAADTGATVPVEAPPPAVEELGYHDLLAGSGTAAKPSEPATTPPPEPVTEAPPPASPPATAAAEPPPAADGGWFLQVGAFRGREAADGLVAKLKAIKVSAFVLVPTRGAPDQLFRVRVGPYGTQSEADDVRARLVREGYTPRVTR